MRYKNSVSLNNFHVYNAMKVNLQIEKNSAEKTSEISALREELEACKDQLNDSELQLRDLAEEYDSKVRYLLGLSIWGFNLSVVTCSIRLEREVLWFFSLPALGGI